MRTIYIYIYFTLFILILSCNKKVDWSEEINIELKAVSDISKEIEIGNHFFNIDELSLSISSIEITGQRLQAPDVTVIKNDPIVYNFNNNTANEHHYFDLPIGTYENMVVKINLENDDKTLLEGLVNSTSSPTSQQELEIPLDFDKTIEINVLNQDEEPIILIDDSLIRFELIFETKSLFDNVSATVWKALTQANLGQSEINLNSIVGDEFIQEIQQGIETSFSLKAIK